MFPQQTIEYTANVPIPVGTTEVRYNIPTKYSYISLFGQSAQTNR